MGENVLRVVTADSGAAILNGHFKPLLIVAATAVLVKPPYRKASLCLSEPIFKKVEDGSLLIVHELELCQDLLKDVEADVVHLDMSLGGLSLEELSVVQLSRMRVSSKARRRVLKILPKLRKIASDIRRVYGLDVLAIGKESIPVRVAELTCGAYAVLYSAEKAVEEESRVRLGLPTKCYARVFDGGVTVHSLLPAEHDIVGYVKDEDGFLERVDFLEMLNPCARGFRVLEFIPTS